MANEFLGGHMRKAMINLAALAVPIIGVGAWAGMKYGPSLYATMMGR